MLSGHVLSCSPHMLQMWDCGRDCTVGLQLFQTHHPHPCHRPILYPDGQKKLIGLSSLKPWGLLSAGLLFLSGSGGCIQGFSLNMVTSSLHGHIAVAAYWHRLPAKLKKTRRMLLPTLRHGSAFTNTAEFVCLPRLLPPA